MAIKFITILAICLALAVAIDARHVQGNRERSAIAHRPQTHKQARVFPGAVAIKKLVLLKFKKIVPISLILLKSSNDNEAELVPVYPTDQIPDNVQFIPTPNGISGHKDVQAIAIPSELHDQLQASGLANLENIEALLQNAAIAEPADGSAAGNVASNSGANIIVAQPEDAPLDVKEEDEDQLLEGASAEPENNNNNNNNNNNTNNNNNNNNSAGLRRLSSTQNLLRVGLQSQPQQTSVEEIPLLLYSSNDSTGSFNAGRLSGRRFYAAAPVRRRNYD